MKFSSPALILYIIATIFAVVGVSFGIEIFELIAKPMIVPAIYFYYVQSCKGEINLLFTIAIFCSFSADMMVLINFPDNNLPISIMNICMYAIFTYFILLDIGFSNIANDKIKSLIGFSIFFFFMLYIILDLMKGVDDLLFYVFAFYGILLSILSALICYNNLNKPSSRSYYALLMCICFIVSDVFFAIYNFYLKIEIFVTLNVIGQFISYYYMVRYITSDNKLKMENNEE